MPNKALGFASCFIGILAARLVLYFTYSTRGHALTYTYVASRHVCMYACIQLLLTFLRKLRSDTIILSEVYQVEGFSNWIQIERMVSNYFIKNVNEEVWDKDIHAHIHTHVHIHTCILTSWTKTMVRCTLAK